MDRIVDEKGESGRRAGLHRPPWQQALHMDDKKRVLVESGAEKAGSELEMKKVSAAIRMLGSSFFTKFTSGKREKNQKTYDHLAFGVDEVEEYSEDHAWEVDDPMEEENLEILAAEDEDVDDSPVRKCADGHSPRGQRVGHFLCELSESSQTATGKI